MRLIDADEVYKILTEYYHHRTDMQHTVLKEALSRVPTIEAEPTRHGHWHFEEYPDGYYHSQCSLCNSWFSEDAFLNPYKWCPFCGALMDEVEE